MKTTQLLTTALLLGISILFTNCKKKTGCTDAVAYNYDSEAKKDDGSCTYKGSIVFWHTQTTYYSLLPTTNLNYYVDGTLIGTSATSVYSSTAPSCGQSGTVSSEIDLGTSKSKNVSYVVKAVTTGIEKFSGSVTLQANSCTALQLN